MAKIHFVKRARKDNPAVKAGEPYYWTKFNYAPKRYFATRPTRAQATKSSFLSSIYELEERIWLITVPADVDEFSMELAELQGECQDSFGNMPEQFHETSWSAELLQCRIETLDEWISGLDGQDYEDMSVDELREFVEDNNPGGWS